MRDPFSGIPPTLLVGRERELGELQILLPSARCIALVGVGGCGKTRLAAEFARVNLSEFQDGIAWVDLAPLADPGLVVNAVSAALDVKEQPEHPLLEAVIAFVKTRQILLILDNCEHLIEACRALAIALLRACPEVQILATSREPLALPGENVFVVSPLTLPSDSSPQAALNAEAVRLFALRAAEILPSFVLSESNLSPVVRICERLDGLPLAIEFAAARVKMLTVHEIAERLDRRFLLLTRSPRAHLSRHQTLRAAMEWSYNLLSPPEQILFRRLAVFAGSFTLDAAETVCIDASRATHDTALSPIHPSGVIDLISELADKSLLVVTQREEGTPIRYGMLETVREYAREMLEEANETQGLRDRHLAWYLALAERARPEFFGTDSARWSARYKQERDNFHSALRWSMTSHQTEVGLNLASTLWIAWEISGDYSAGIFWFEALLANAASGSIAPVVQANALQSLAAMLYRQGNVGRAQELATRSLEMIEAMHDRAIPRAFATNLLGVIANHNAQFAEAIDFFERARALYLQENEPGRAASVLHNLGLVAQRQGRLAAASEYLQVRVGIAREIGDRPGLSLTLNLLGEIEMEQGHYARAESLTREGLTIAREWHGTVGESDSLRILATLALYHGEVQEAERLAAEALALGDESGIKPQITAAKSVLGDIAFARDQNGRALEYYEQALTLNRELGNTAGIAHSTHALAGLLQQIGGLERATALQHEALSLFQLLGNGLYLARGLEGAAEFAVGRGDALRAAHFLGAAGSLRAQVGTPPHPPERARIERILRKAGGALGENAIETALERGRALDVDNILDAAIALTRSENASSVEAPHPTLEIFGLGSSQVVLEGQVLDMSRWTYVKSKELFFYLLSHPAATKAQIGVDLWPDASPVQLRRAFHRTMHFVRKALGEAEWIMYENERYGLNPAREYFYDVDSFDAQRKRAMQLLRADTPERATGIQALEAAVEFYRGEFLADIEGGDWILFRREEIRRQFLDALLTLGRLWSEDGRYEQAAAAYRRILEEDDYLEVAHRELIRCLARQGDVRQALQHYHRLTELLRREFNAPPSAQTQALYEQLQRGEHV